MFGVDNTFLSRVVDADVFEPYEAAGLDAVPDELRALVPRRRGHARSTSATCASTTTSPGSTSTTSTRRPTSTRSPTRRTRDLLVVENPATSSPGLAFLMATIAEFGEDGWADYWSRPARQRRRGRRRLDRGLLRALLRRRRRPQAARRQLRHEPAGRGACSPTRRSTRRRRRSSTTTCFRQVEFAGVLRGTDARRRGPPARRLPASPSASRPSCR